jgi:hypothetical protein
MDIDDLKKGFVDIFEEVKEVVRKNEGASRAGLMLGLQDLGASYGGFVGAYYPVESNIIVVNTAPLEGIAENDPGLLKPYIFHVLLHEYLHALGILDENATRRKTYEISRRQFGERHIITELSRDMEKYVSHLVYPAYGWPPEGASGVELVKGFDRSSTQGYIT